MDRKPDWKVLRNIRLLVCRVAILLLLLALV